MNLAALLLGILLPLNLQVISLRLWIDRLAQKESDDVTTIKHLDSNGLYSYGCLQFQEYTWKTQIEKYHLLPNAEKEEYMNSIYDCDLAKQLAEKMILDDRNNWRHWYNSVQVIGLPPEGEIEIVINKKRP